MSLLEVNIIRKDFPLNSTKLNVLQNVQFSVEKGEFVSIIGPSGIIAKTNCANIEKRNVQKKLCTFYFQNIVDC